MSIIELLESSFRALGQATGLTTPGINQEIRDALWTRWMSVAGYNGFEPDTVLQQMKSAEKSLGTKAISGSAEVTRLIAILKKQIERLYGDAEAAKHQAIINFLTSPPQ